ncbi:MAG: FAD-binding oxidoreductase [Proteobacteria bacterium]|nr:FAD-binding oxidoreductase [Pseudomonadota bacterium]
MEVTARRVKRGWMNLKVVQIVEDTWDCKTFFMEDLEEGGRTWDYWAGQYLTIRYDDVAEKPLVRSYTMSSSPRQVANCAVTVKRVEGGLISNWMCDNIKVGTVLRARGPIGKFIYEQDKDKAHLVMVAAGSGVTPFISIMREYQDRLGQSGSPQKMTLVVSYRSRKDLILWRDIEEIARHPGCQVFVSLSRDNDAPSTFYQGRLSMDSLNGMLNSSVDFTNATFMSCGPQAIMDMAKSFAQMKGVPDSQIKTESFES